MFFLLPVDAPGSAGASSFLLAELPHAPLAKPSQPFPGRPCGVCVAAWHAFVLWHASCVRKCYIAVDRVVPCGFLPTVKSVSANAGSCKLSRSTVRVSGKLCKRAAPVASAAIALCWTLFPRAVGHRDHIFSVLYTSYRPGRTCIAPFGASPRNARALANRNTPSIAMAAHPPHGEQRILYIFFCFRRVSIGPPYIRFSVSGPRIRRKVCQNTPHPPGEGSAARAVALQ